MPSFELDVDVDEFIYEMSNREKKEMYQKLKKDFLDEVENPFDDFGFNISAHPSIMDKQLLEALIKIFNNRLKLSIEEENDFINFSKKF